MADRKEVLKRIKQDLKWNVITVYDLKGLISDDKDKQQTKQVKGERPTDIYIKPPSSKRRDDEQMDQHVNPMKLEEVRVLTDYLNTLKGFRTGRMSESEQDESITQSIERTKQRIEEIMIGKEVTEDRLTFDIDGKKFVEVK